MQFPFIHYLLKKHNLEEKVKVVPIMVGHLGKENDLDSEYAQVLKDYFLKPDTIFVFSTDFCHWGFDYGFTPFKDKGQEIYKYIEKMDREGIDLIFNKKSTKFIEYLEKSENNICGQNVMRILIMIASTCESQFLELKYRQAQKVQDPDDWSVSYYAASLFHL